MQLIIRRCKKQALNECVIRNGTQGRESVTAYTTERFRNWGHSYNNADQTFVDSYVETYCLPVGSCQFTGK